MEEALADLNQWIGSTQRRVDFEAKRDEFVERELSPMLQRLERFLETNPCGPAFWVGSSLTFVDLIALGMLDCTGSMFPRAMEERHVLQQLCDGIAARPRISAYLDSPRRPPGIQYGPTGKRIDARSREGWRT